MALSYHKLFALPKLQARQKFHVHVYMYGDSSGSWNMLKEVKDRRYKLKAAQGR